MNTKEEIKVNFEQGDVPTQEDFEHLIDSQVGVLDYISELPGANSNNVGVCYLVGGNTIHRCEYTGGNYVWVPYPFTTSSVNDYLNLTHKPSIGGHVLGTENSLHDIGAAAENHTHYYAGAETSGGAANSVAKSLKVTIQNGTVDGKDRFYFDGSSATSVSIDAETMFANMVDTGAVHANDYIVIFRGGAPYRVKISALLNPTNK